MQELVLSPDFRSENKQDDTRYNRCCKCTQQKPTESGSSSVACSYSDEYVKDEIDNGADGNHMYPSISDYRRRLLPRRFELLIY